MEKSGQLNKTSPRQALEALLAHMVHLQFSPQDSDKQLILLALQVYSERLFSQQHSEVGSGHRQLDQLQDLVHYQEEVQDFKHLQVVSTLANQRLVQSFKAPQSLQILP